MWESIPIQRLLGHSFLKKNFKIIKPNLITISIPEAFSFPNISDSNNTFLKSLDLFFGLLNRKLIFLVLEVTIVHGRWWSRGLHKREAVHASSPYLNSYCWWQSWKMKASLNYTNASNGIFVTCMFLYILISHNLQNLFSDFQWWRTTLGEENVKTSFLLHSETI